MSIYAKDASGRVKSINTSNWSVTADKSSMTLISIAPSPAKSPASLPNAALSDLETATLNSDFSAKTAALSKHAPIRPETPTTAIRIFVIQSIYQKNFLHRQSSHVPAGYVVSHRRAMNP